MECRTARSLFSEHHDSRLDAHLDSLLQSHLLGCATCAREWSGYRRVLAVAETHGQVSDGRPFHHPAGPPGTLPASAFRQHSLVHRVAVAAVILIAVAAVHFGVFAAGGLQRETPSEPIQANLGPLAPSSEPAVLQALRDHLDMSDLFARQVAQFPSEPGDAGKQVLDASIELLNADGLEDLLRRTDISFLGDHGKQSLSEYVAYVRRLEELRGGLRGVESAEAMRSVRHELARLGFCNLIRQLRLAVGPADTALARAGGLDFQDQRLQDSPEEVRAYLDCRDRFLARDYLAAAEELRRFQERFPESRLVPVAIQLQAQALVAGGRWEEGMKLFAGLGQVNCPPPARMVSTVGARGAFPERPLFALLATLGLGRMPEPGEVLFSPGLSADPDRQMVFRMFYLTSPQDGSGPQPRVVEVEIQVPVQAGSTLR